jgi:two-component system, LytTR family, sensor kinase
LILITFIENGCKHLSNYTDRTNKICIQLQSEETMLVLKVSNTTEKSEFSSESHAIGLINTKRRLELLYPGKHSLEASNLNGIYSITLKIDFT